MIPKIIHYCWFSDEEFPPIVKKCIDSWHRHMPDYEFRLWDMEAIKDIDIPFVREALECRKWAFASDYVRLYAVEKYGGIYLDTDIEVFESFDKLLDSRMFVGREVITNIYNGRPVQFLTSHVYGAEAHHPFIKDLMLYYETRHFMITEEKRLPEVQRCDYTMGPEIMALIGQEYGYKMGLGYDKFMRCKDGVDIYPSYVLGAYGTRKNSYMCIHYMTGSWRRTDVGTISEDLMVTKIPLWRKAVEKLKIRNKLVVLLKKLGYVAYKI